MAPADTESIVPVIDVAALCGDDAEGKAAVCEQLGHACENIGFFVIVNHGVPAQVIDRAWGKSLEFFDLPLQDKVQFTTEDEAKYPYGYSSVGGETLSHGKAVDDASPGTAATAVAGDLKEMMQIGPNNPESGMPQRRMPDNPEGFREAWEEYYDEVNGLAHRLLGGMAVALGLDEEFFKDKMDRHVSALRVNNYPDQEGMDVPEGAIRCSAHTDYGTLTILRSGGPGLQVSKDSDDPVWQDVPYVPDGFVINLGDLMRRWTNDSWSSTLHRVVNPPAGKAGEWGRRMAMAFFHNLNRDAVVEAIPSCVDDERPALYEPIVAGDFLMLKHLASQGKADKDAHLKRK